MIKLYLRVEMSPKDRAHLLDCNAHRFDLVAMMKAACGEVYSAMLADEPPETATVITGESRGEMELPGEPEPITVASA